MCVREIIHLALPWSFAGTLLTICCPSGCTVVSGVVVGVCNRSQMRTSKCICLIFGVSICLDPGSKRTKEIFDRSKFKVTRDISPTISGWLLVSLASCTGYTCNETSGDSCSLKDCLLGLGTIPFELVAAFSSFFNRVRAKAVPYKLRFYC